MTIPPEARPALDALRAQVAALHAELTHYELVIWTAGNVSARVPGHDLMVIKPSGVAYDELSAERMVVTDLYGNLVEGDFAPSSDTAAHAYVYRHMPEVGGVVHTHSTYACAWAARREAIPCVLTMIADEFGGEIPIGPDARSAVKAAVMLEDVARTVHISRQLGEPVPLATEDIDGLYERYQNVYGQHGGPQ